LVAADSSGPRRAVLQDNVLCLVGGNCPLEGSIVLVPLVRQLPDKQLQAAQAGELPSLKPVAGMVFRVIAANVHADGRMDGELLRELQPHLNLGIRRRAELDNLGGSLPSIVNTRFPAQTHLHERQLDLRLPRRPIEKIVGRSINSNSQRVVGIAGIADLEVADLRPLQSRTLQHGAEEFFPVIAGYLAQSETEAHFAVAAR